MPQRQSNQSQSVTDLKNQIKALVSNQEIMQRRIDILERYSHKQPSMHEMLEAALEIAEHSKTRKPNESPQRLSIRFPENSRIPPKRYC